MRALILSLVLLCGLVTVSFAQQSKEDKAISPLEAGEHVGKTVAVEGRCVSVKRMVSAIELYFGPSFRVFIPLKSLRNFRTDPMKRYPRRNLRVTGKVEDKQGLIFMRVEKPKQIKILRRKRKPTSN